MARSFDARLFRRLATGVAAGAALLWSAVMVVVAAPTASAPATGPSATQPAERQKPDEAFLQGQRRQRQMMQTQFANLRQVPVAADGAPRLTLDRGLLHVEAADAVAPAPAGTEQVRLKVEGSNATWVMSRRPAPVVVGANVPDPGPTLMVQRFDPDAKADDEVWSIYLSANNNALSLMGQSVVGRVMLSQSTRNPRPVSMTVMEWTPGPRMANVFTAQAETVQQLRAEHPAEFRQYLLPLLGKMSDPSWMLPDAADVYRAFPDIPADPAVMQRLMALLPDLDAAAFPTREAASRRLTATGRAGVLAVLRLDPARLTDEQRGRLAQFVAAYRHRDDLDPAAAHNDPMFLADALEYPDPTVRAAALQALERFLGKPVEFDVGLAGDALTAATDAIRKQVAERATAATRPGGT